MNKEKIVNQWLSSEPEFIDIKTLNIIDDIVPDFAVKIGEHIYPCVLESFDDKSYRHQYVKCTINFCFRYFESIKKFSQIESPGPEYLYRKDEWGGL